MNLLEKFSSVGRYSSTTLNTFHLLWMYHQFSATAGLWIHMVHNMICVHSSSKLLSKMCISPKPTGIWAKEKSENDHYLVKPALYT